MTLLQRIGMGATTSPAQAGLIQGFSAVGGEEAVTKRFVINDEEAMVEDARLDMEVKQYDLLLKRAKFIPFERVEGNHQDITFDGTMHEDNSGRHLNNSAPRIDT